MEKTNFANLGGGRTHGMRVALISKAAAIACGFSMDAADELAFAAAFHDLGKVAVPNSVLYKQGPLTPEERLLIQKHPTYGAELLPPELSDEHPMMRPIILCHHERWDGSGYPNGLRGYDISLAAQLVGAADCLDALCSKRVYKDRMPLEMALNMLLHNQCGPFDRMVYTYLSSAWAKEFFDLVFLEDDPAWLDTDLTKKVESACLTYATQQVEL